MDWMYQGGVGAMHDANQREEQRGREEQVQPVQEAPGTRVEEERRPSLPSFYEQDNPSSANEIWQRLHGDPLMIMKQQELQARRSIVSNPVKMDAIKKRAKEERRRKHKSSKSRHRSRDRHDSDGGDGNDDGRHSRRRHRHHSSRRHRHESPSRKSRRREERPSHRDASPEHHHTKQDPRYGISFASNAPDAVKQKDRSSVIENTQKRLEEAARRREREQQEQAAQRRSKRAHTTGRLTEEEKRRKLEEMAMSAKEFEQNRSERVSSYRNKAHAEEEELYDANRNSSRDFLRQEALARLHTKKL